MTEAAAGPERITPGLAHVLDVLAISQLKARYCRLLDTKDWDGLATLFTDDFELDVREAAERPTVRGREAALAFIRASVETATTAHHVHSPEIEVAGDVAHGVWAMQDRVVWPVGSSSHHALAGITGYGHYHERYVRQGGGWRMAASRLTRLHIDLQHRPDAA